MFAKRYLLSRALRSKSASGIFCTLGECIMGTQCADTQCADNSGAGRKWQVARNQRTGSLVQHFLASSRRKVLAPRLLLAFALAASACTRKSVTCQSAPGESCIAYKHDSEEACEAHPECTWLSQCSPVTCAGRPSVHCIADETCEWDDEQQLCTRIPNASSDACQSLGLGGSPSECSMQSGCGEPRCVLADGQRLCNDMSLSDCERSRRCEVVTKHRPIITSQ